MTIKKSMYPLDLTTTVNLPIVSYEGMAHNDHKQNNSFVLPPIDDIELNKIIEAHRASEEAFIGSNITQKAFNKFRDHICRSVLGMENGSYQQLRALWEQAKCKNNLATSPPFQSITSILNNMAIPEELIKKIEDQGRVACNNNEDYSDMEIEITFQEETEKETRYSFNLHLCFAWDEKDVYLVLGKNLGNGFDDHHQVDDDGRPFEIQIIDALRKIEEKNSADEYIQLVKSHPLAHQGIIDGAKSLSKELGR